MPSTVANSLRRHHKKWSIRPINWRAKKSLPPKFAPTTAWQNMRKGYKESSDFGVVQNWHEMSYLFYLLAGFEHKGWIMNMCMISRLKAHEAVVSLAKFMVGWSLRAWYLCWKEQDRWRDLRFYLSWIPWVAGSNRINRNSELLRTHTLWWQQLSPLAASRNLREVS